MMWLRRSGYPSRWYSACFLVLALSLWFFCALPSGLWAASEETSPTSEPDWPVLLSYLGEIDSGLQMTDAPLISIEKYFEGENSRLESEKTELQNEREQLQQENARLQWLEQELNARERDLNKRESLYAGMQVSLEDAQKRLKRGWIWIVGAALLGGGIGYAIGR